MSRIQFQGIELAALAGVTILFACGGFYTGRQTIKFISSGEERSLTTKPMGLRHRSAESIDFKNILIERVATIGFSELYDVMEEASPGLRAAWLRQVQQMTPGLKRTAALTTFYKVLVQLDPDAATASLIHSDPASGQLIALRVIAGAAQPSSMDKVAEALLQLPREMVRNSQGRDYLADVIREWGWADPAAVSRFLEEHKSEDLSGYAKRLVEGWSQMDPAAARAWVDQYQAEQGDLGLIQLWLYGWYENDRAAALNYLVTHTSERDVRNSLEGITYALFAESPESARAFVERLPTAEAQQSALGMLQTSASDQDESSTLYHPPRVMAEWFIKLPNAAWQRALGPVLARWNQVDPDEVATWMNQLPVEKRDPAVALYCLSAAGELEHHINLALTISDSTLREQTLREFLTSSSRGPVSETEVAITDSNLAPSTKGYLLKLLKTRQSELAR